MAFESEIDDILRELLREPGALSAIVATAGAVDVEASVQRMALGGGAELVVATAPVPPPELPAAIERAARDLRACIRRHGVTEVPEVKLVGRAPRTRAALVGKVTDLLAALSAMHRAAGAVLLRGNEILATGGALDETHRAQLGFLRRRLDAEALKHRGRTSHAEIVGEDFYSRSFWFGAYLVIFFAESGFAVDFVRHRARATCRLLSVVLPYLEPEPPTPANVRPLPPRDPKRR